MASSERSDATTPERGARLGVRVLGLHGTAHGWGRAGRPEREGSAHVLSEQRTPAVDVDWGDAIGNDATPPIMNDGTRH